MCLVVPREKAVIKGSLASPIIGLLFFLQLVRLVANLSVHPEVGPRIAGDEDTVDCLMMTLGRCG